MFPEITGSVRLHDIQLKNTVTWATPGELSQTLHCRTFLLSFQIFVLMGLGLIYNVVPISIVQQSDSVIYITHVLF